MSDHPPDFLAELRRCRVFRTAGYDAVVSSGVWGAAEVVVDALSLAPEAAFLELTRDLSRAFPTTRELQTPDLHFLPYPERGKER